MFNSSAEEEAEDEIKVDSTCSESGYLLDLDEKPRKKYRKRNTKIDLRR